MRGLLCFGAVAVVLVVVFAAFRLSQRGAKALATGAAQSPPRLVPAGGRWSMRHYAETGHTVVAVARVTPGGEVIEEHVVDRVHDSAPDWSHRFLLAKQEAEERAFHLNADL